LDGEILRDLEEWVHDCLTYNSSFIENQELLEKLILTCQQDGESINIEEIKRAITKI